MIVVFIGIYTASFLLFNNWKTVSWLIFIPLVAAYLGTIGVFFTNLIYAKGIFLSAGILWLIYEYNTGLFGQMIGEGLSFLANLTAMIILINAARNHIPVQDLEDVDTHAIHIITESIAIIGHNARNITTAKIPIIAEESSRSKEV